MHKVDKNIKLPFDDETFDIVYTKSFLEHISDPEPLILEFKRILKTGGKMINLVPDWETNFKIYFDDFTHKRPFTKFTLEDLYKVTGFINYKVETFRQLPITWKYKSINFYVILFLFSYITE